MIPKIIVEISKLENEYVNFLSEISFNEFYELKQLLKESKNKKLTIKNFLNNFINSNIKNLEIKKKEIIKILKPINTKTMKTFEKINEIKWNNKHKKFHIKIGFTKLSPRFLNSNTFYIYYKSNKNEIIDTYLHEISHFIFFEKFKEIYPDTSIKEFDYPNLIWKMSEMIPRIVLKDNRIQKIHKNEYPAIYDCIAFMKIKNKPIIMTLFEFYNTKKNFSNFIINSYNYIKENSNEINKKFNN